MREGPCRSERNMICLHLHKNIPLLQHRSRLEMETRYSHISNTQNNYLSFKRAVIFQHVPCVL